MINAGPTAVTDRPLGVSIRIEVDMDTDDRLDEWAKRENRSKREHVRHLVNEMIEAYRSDPLILHRIALARAGSRPLSA